MTRLNKFMVYNPKKDKPVKYYKTFTSALEDAIILREKERQDILVMEVVAIADSDNLITDSVKTSKYRSGLKFEIVDIKEN